MGTERRTRGEDMVYLDWAATTPPDLPLLAPALEESAQLYANPSSPHAAGKAARAAFEAARASLMGSLAAFAGGRAPKGELVFTGSGTEADQIPLLALLSARGASAAPHLVISAIEHAAIASQAEALAKLGFSVTSVRPGADGAVVPEKVAEALRPNTKLVAVMAVNNETGAVNDIGAIGRTVGAAAASLGMARPPLFHVDCVQALGKIPFDLAAAGATSAAFSAHKLRGPRGVGALWHSRPIEALAVGGGQESGIRSGTENLFGALAFSRCAAAAAASLPEHLALARNLECRLLEGLAAISGATVVPLGRTPGDPRWSPWIASAAFPGLGGEVFSRALSDSGIAVSTGSACSHSKGAAKGRRVLDAMGLPADLAFSSIRLSWGPTTAPGDIDRFLETASVLYRSLKT
ncbi:aminotransferase class V-fold PLP-dependent enzyme [bacterium]|nr:aminotransferase class V-fold PLP-dependent enzyme [bacterium]